MFTVFVCGFCDLGFIAMCLDHDYSASVDNASAENPWSDILDGDDMSGAAPTNFFGFAICFFSCHELLIADWA